MRGANSYLVINDGTLLVIDTGLPGNARRIVKYILSLDKKPADVSHVILTHGDIDHIGSAAELKKLTDGKLVIHAGDAPILAGKAHFKTIGGVVGVFFGLLMPLLRFHPVEPDVIVQNRLELAGFQLIPTPGHTKGSLSIYLPGKLVFAGDAIYRRFMLDRAQARSSLELISILDFEAVFPGHGAPITRDASAQIKGILARNFPQ